MQGVTSKPIPTLISHLGTRGHVPMVTQQRGTSHLYHFSIFEQKIQPGKETVPLDSPDLLGGKIRRLEHMNSLILGINISKR